MRTFRLKHLTAITASVAVAVAPSFIAACGGGSPASPSALIDKDSPVPKGSTLGQTSFKSVAPPGASGSRGEGGGVATASGAAADAGAAAPSNGGSSTSSNGRVVQETDLYRLDGTKLYYFNSYRGLMVFDVSNVDSPKFLGRSAIFGTPIDMIVNNGIAVVIVGDWYGTLDNGTPFYGSIVRGLDATDPTNIKVLGDAKLGGEIQDTRVVGNVIYAVSEDWGYTYGWDFGYGGYGGSSTPDVIVSSVSFANNQIMQVASKRYAGYGGVFYVTPNAIMLAHSPNEQDGYDDGDAGGATSSVAVDSGGGGGLDGGTDSGTVDGSSDANLEASLSDATSDGSSDGSLDGGYEGGFDAGTPPSPGVSTLEYLDITDPGGAIVSRGSIQVTGSVNTWGADNGRWTLDFADGQTAHLIGCVGDEWTCGEYGYVLSTVDFANPDSPALDSTYNIPNQGWSIAAYFDTGRLYLSPSSWYWNAASTPLQVYDLSNPSDPKLAGRAEIPGQSWLILPSGNQLFDLGQTNTDSSSQVSLTYLDVTVASNPKIIGTSTFGDGWAWTPAAETFKAFTMDPTTGLVVLPFSGWDASSGSYNNGVQLIEYSPTSIATAGAAHTKGWVERGIFVGNRIVSLSDLALSVINYTNPVSPTVTASLTLARNVVAAQPGPSTIAEVSSDWWYNDISSSQVRVLPINDAAENLDESNAPQVNVDGVGANVFTNGNLTYVVTTVEVPAACQQWESPPCTAAQEQVQVVDLSNNTATLRGKIALPVDPNAYWYWDGLGWYGDWFWDSWYDGAEIVQVGNSALAFRRWDPTYDANGNYINASCDLYIIDLSNPDHPTLASTTVITDQTAWWGDMQVIGNTLYVMDYEWVPQTNDAGADAGVNEDTTYYVKYFLDPIDLTNRANPTILAKINVPGMLVGGSSTDPSILYTVDYQWLDNSSYENFDVVQVSGSTATLLAGLTLDGYSGNFFISGNTAYASVQSYSAYDGDGSVELHQIDISNPSVPVDYNSTGKKGWGWLLSVQGNRALVTSGWGYTGIDVYKLSSNSAPVYDQFLQANGWMLNSAARQGNTLYLSSGYWGVEPYTLQ